MPMTLLFFSVVFSFRLQRYERILKMQPKENETLAV